MTRNEFLKGKIRTPVPLRADAYTISGQGFASEKAREKSVYNMVNRKSPKDAFPSVANDSRMVFFGLVEYIRSQLMDRCTIEDVDKADEFMKSAHSMGGPLFFDKELWYRIVNDYDGYLPIKIEALPEGSTFFPNEPVMQVTSLDSGFGEIAAHIEAICLGMVSIATARATLTRHWRAKIEDMVQRDVGPDSEEAVQTLASFMIHDFGMRASSCAEESELLGMAHLLCFNGTDTFNAAFQAIEQGGARPTGTSIHALAHRIVQGHDNEREAFDSIREASRMGNGMNIASYVADCYNFEAAVMDHLSEIAKKHVDDVIVVRPDSGDYVKNVILICQEAVRQGLYEDKGKDGWPRAHGTSMRYIQGDSMNPDKIDEIVEALRRRMFAPSTWGIYGVGGWLRNTPNRDSLSSAYKLSARGHKFEPVTKLSETPAKMSIPGPNQLVRPKMVGESLFSNQIYPDRFNLPVPTTFFSHNELPDTMKADFHNAYATYYDATDVKDGNHIGDACLESFEIRRERCINNFDEYRHLSEKFTTFGMNGGTLCEAIHIEQDDVYFKHRGTK